MKYVTALFLLALTALRRRPRSPGVFVFGGNSRPTLRLGGARAADKWWLRARDLNQLDYRRAS
jgi:hypothetical protein